MIIMTEGNSRWRVIISWRKREAEKGFVRGTSEKGDETSGGGVGCQFYLGAVDSKCPYRWGNLSKVTLRVS